MEFSKQCKHSILSDNTTFSFCISCGSLIYDKIPTIKPHRFNYRIEINPLLILKNMIYENQQVNEILKDKIINESILERRCGYIKYLNKLVHKLQFRSQTFYIACFYFDYILKVNNDIDPENVAIGSILLASKFDEMDSIIPDMSKYQSLFNKIYFSIEELKKNELLCLSILKYKLNYYTAYHFINFFFSFGIVFEDDEIIKDSQNQEKILIDKKIADKVYDVTKEVLLYFVEDIKSLEFNSLEIACTSITIGREKLNLKYGWHERFEEVLNMKLKDFKNCYDIVKSFYSLIYESRNKNRFTNKNSIEQDKIRNYKNPINPSSKEKKEILVLTPEDNIDSYRAISNEKIDSNRIMKTREKILFRSNDEVDILERITDYKNLKSLNNDFLELNKLDSLNKLHNEKIIKNFAKNNPNNNNYETEYPAKKRVKFSDDYSTSDLIHKTRTLLLKTNKLKNGDIDRPASRNNEKDQISRLIFNSNVISSHRYKHKYNNEINYNHNYHNNYERNKSINILDLRTTNLIYDNKMNNITNFNYNKRDPRVAYHYYKEKYENNSKDKAKEYTDLKEEVITSQENIDLYKNSKMDKIFNKEIIKKKIDREIYNRQKYNYVNVGNGNESKEYNFLANNLGEYNDGLEKLKTKNYDNNRRNSYYEYKHNLIHEKTSFLY